MIQSVTLKITLSAKTTLYLVVFNQKKMGGVFSFPEPSPRWGHFTAPVGGQLYLWGGRTRNFFYERKGLSSSLHRFDPVLKTRLDIVCTGPPPPALYNGSCVATGSHLYLYGGTDGAELHDSLFKLKLDTKLHAWQQIITKHGSRPMRKTGCGMVTYGNKLVLYGGYGIASASVQQQESEFVSLEYTNKKGWTNELHTFDLFDGIIMKLKI